MGLLARAIEALKLEPTFGIRSWTPGSTCGDVHPHGPMPKGSRCCCMAKHCTGIEGHPLLKETATDRLRRERWEPPPEGDPWTEQDRAEPTRYEGRAKAEPPKTRKEKRDARYGRTG